MNNYDKQALQAQRAFVCCDQEEMIAKVQCRADEAFIYYDFCGEPYRLNRFSGAVERLVSGTPEPAGFNEIMSLYDLFGYSRAGACLTGKWVSTLNLANNVPSNALGRGFYTEIESLFDQNPEALAKLFKDRGYQSFPVGEVACQFPVFPCLPGVFQFWRGDEEFPPKVKFLWDANTLAFLHYETIYYVQAHWLQRVQESL